MQRYQAPRVPLQPVYPNYYAPQYGYDPRSYAPYANGYPIRNPTQNQIRPLTQIRGQTLQKPISSHLSQHDVHHAKHARDHSHHSQHRHHSHHSPHHHNHEQHRHHDHRHRHHHHHRQSDEDSDSDARRYHYVRNNYCQTSPMAFLKITDPEDDAKKPRGTPELLKDVEAEKLKRRTPDILRDDFSPDLIPECATPDGFGNESATSRDPKQKTNKSVEPSIPEGNTRPELSGYGFTYGNRTGVPNNQTRMPLGYPPATATLMNPLADRKVTPGVKKK